LFVLFVQNIDAHPTLPRLSTVLLSYVTLYTEQTYRRAFNVAKPRDEDAACDQPHVFAACLLSRGCRGTASPGRSARYPRFLPFSSCSRLHAFAACLLSRGCRGTPSPGRSARCPRFLPFSSPTAAGGTKKLPE